MKKMAVIIVAAMMLIGCGAAMAGDTNGMSAKESKLLIYKGQQVKIYNEMLDREAQISRVIGEISFTPNWDRKVDRLQKEIKELEDRLSELQLKVVDLADGYPSWWNENEV